jgi:uncharacterized repeat protein (TIGR02543 family)
MDQQRPKHHLGRFFLVLLILLLIGGLVTGAILLFNRGKASSQSGSSSSADSSFVDSSSSSVSYHAVAFSLNGYYGFDDPAVQEIADGGFAVEPTISSRPGYLLEGWSTSPTSLAAWSFASGPVTGNLTLYAIWALQTYVAKFDLNGGAGAAIPEQTSTYLAYDETGITSKLIEPSASVTKSGFVLDGWWLEDGEGHFSQEWDFASDLLLGDVTLYAGWASTLTYGAYTVSEYASAIKITSYDKSSANGILTIPSSFNGKPVLCIGKGAFEYFIDGDTENVVLPSTLTTLEESAFQGCSSVYQLSIPSGVTSIGKMAFDSCDELYDVVIGSGVRNIGEMAFYQCSNLNSSGTLTLPPNVLSIEKDAFDIVTTGTPLTKIVFAEGLEFIGEEAFAHAHVDSIDLPDTLAYIGRTAFAYCSSAQQIHLGRGLMEIGYASFSDTGGNTPSYLHVYLTAGVPPTLDDAVAFGLFTTTNGIPSRASFWIVVPADSVDAYKAADNWKTYYASRIVSFLLQ